MKIYFTSNIPLPIFDKISVIGANISKNPPADFVIEDIIALFQMTDTTAVNSQEIALDKIKSNKAKYIYSLEVKEVD